MDPTRREIRVFVSSTFRDLIAEREYLIKRVFPELRRYSRERELEFTEIDLRWGLTEEDAALGRIVRTCLEEIDRCSPFYVCIFGDRYGWSPQYTDIQRDPTLLHEYPWLEEAVLEEQSIFEMEATYALLRRPAAPGQFVYARNSPNANERDAAKLEALKQRIRDAGHTIQNFNTPEELGALVRRDLLATIEARWPEATTKATLDPQTQERRMHESFAAARRKAYIADIENINALNKNAESSRVPLVATAPSGMGKSALLAYWSKYYKARHPESLVITHFVGLTGTGGSSKDVLRHIFSEIAAHLGDPSLVAQSEDNLAKELSGLLARIAKPVVIVIDALNQLDEGTESLDWLPTFLPENVHLLLSTTEGAVLEQLRERGCDVLPLRPLRANEREALLVRYLGEYRKQLSIEQSRRIAGDEKTASPLFLRTLIEELRLSGAHSTLDARIAKYLSCKSLDELFSHVLERMERDYGEHVVYSILTAIWASQRGLTEKEVLDLSVSRSGQRVTRVELSAFLIALDYQLIVRDGIITLFHDFLRDAVERRYLATEDAKREVHAKLADYFMAERLTKHGAEELIWHLKEARLNGHLRALLLDIDFILYYADDDRKWEYLRLWRELDDEGSSDALEQLANTLLESDSEASALRIVDLLHDAGKYDHTERLSGRLLQSRSKETRLRALNFLGAIYTNRGDYAKGEQFLSEVIQSASAFYGSESPMLVDYHNQLGTLYYMVRNLDLAQESFERALRIAQQAAGRMDARQISSLTNLAAVLYQKGDSEAALTKLIDAEQASLVVNGPLHLETTVIQGSIAATLIALGRAEEAYPIIERCVQRYQSVLGPNHPNTLTAMNNLASAAHGANDYNQAASIWTKLLDQLEMGHLSSSLTLEVKKNLGMSLTYTGEFAAAEALLLAVVSEREQQFGSEHRETLRSYVNLANHYFIRGDHLRAKAIYEKNLPLLKAIESPKRYIELERPYVKMLS